MRNLVKFTLSRVASRELQTQDDKTELFVEALEQWLNNGSELVIHQNFKRIVFGVIVSRHVSSCWLCCDSSVAWHRVVLYNIS